MLKDIHTLRMHHCKAQRAYASERWHIALQMYHHCLEAAERRQDEQATRFFALRLAACYRRMNLCEKANAFEALARQP